MSSLAPRPIIGTPVLAKLDALVQCSAKIKIGLDALKSVEEAMKFVKSYDGNYKGVEPVAALCNGSFSLANHSAAVNLLMAIERGMYFVQRSSKALSKEARQHPDVAKRLTTFAAFVACEPKLKEGSNGLRLLLGDCHHHRKSIVFPSALCRAGQRAYRRL